ncbi:MAG TPA: hypothetical protein VLA82_10550 [Actinomycetota bacterium]|nr:hypothetical protein [Actinomycetota bacterium]
MIRTIARITVATALAVATIGVTPAFANDADVIRRGNCSGASDWKLKLSPEDGRIEVEYEVDQNKNGVQWRVRIFKEGVRIFRGTRTTQAPSGSFEVRVVTGNTTGDDSFTARAVNLSSGEVCRGAATGSF